MSRSMDVINNGKGIRINSPDGLEINVMKTNYNSFKEYVMELAIKEGLDPNESISAVVGRNPSRIVITWQ